MQEVLSPVNIEERKALLIRPGDTVRVHQKIEEKGKTRIQVFEGLVIARKHGDEPGATFTVRTTMSGVGVEKTFPLYSPIIDKLEITKRSKVRRAKLYFIREKVAREVKRQLRRMKLAGLATVSEKEQKDAKEKEEAEAQAKAEADEAANAEANTDTPADTAEENKEEQAPEQDTEAPTEESTKEEESKEEVEAEKE